MDSIVYRYTVILINSASTRPNHNHDVVKRNARKYWVNNWRYYPRNSLVKKTYTSRNTFKSGKHWRSNVNYNRGYNPGWNSGSYTGSVSFNSYTPSDLPLN